MGEEEETNGLISNFILKNKRINKNEIFIKNYLNNNENGMNWSDFIVLYVILYMKMKWHSMRLGHEGKYQNERCSEIKINYGLILK